ncbi:lysophospholipid acyltransferase family protein [Rickettsiales bacterium]|nr:lysophospholipid acyltransferase family protein [Rickettsiales bacterium]MDB2550818.1 lysophospholipid acyltransferase family protein [Rickettsiales bacterium]
MIKTIGWYDIKTKFKHILRLCVYSSIMQAILAFIIVSYMKFVYFTSKKQYQNLDIFLDSLQKGEAILICSWHNKIMMMPLLMYQMKKIKNRKETNSLASKHGDGKIVGNVMNKFGFVNIAGSSNQKKGRGIAINDLKKIIKNLRKGHSLAITPDGPRGPRYKINSHIVNIAKLSGAKILPASCDISRSIRLNSWDKFVFPLPFSKLSFYFDPMIIIDKKISEEEISKKNLEIEERLNYCKEFVKVSIGR